MILVGNTSGAQATAQGQEGEADFSDRNFVKNLRFQWLFDLNGDLLVDRVADAGGGQITHHRCH